jgi:hypothetical protein
LCESSRRIFTLTVGWIRLVIQQSESSHEISIVAQHVLQLPGFLAPVLSSVFNELSELEHPQLARLIGGLVV